MDDLKVLLFWQLLNAKETIVHVFCWFHLFDGCESIDEVISLSIQLFDMFFLLISLDSKLPTYVNIKLSNSLELCKDRLKEGSLWISLPCFDLHIVLEDLFCYKLHVLEMLIHDLKIDVLKLSILQIVFFHSVHLSMFRDHVVKIAFKFRNRLTFSNWGDLLFIHDFCDTWFYKLYWLLILLLNYLLCLCRFNVNKW